jgi:hypothetical protein
VPFLTLPLGFSAILEKKNTFITSYDSVKKIWFNLEPFKHFFQKLVSTRFLFIIQILEPFVHYCIVYNNEQMVHYCIVYNSCIIISRTNIH